MVRFVEKIVKFVKKMIITYYFYSKSYYIFIPFILMKI